MKRVILISFIGSVLLNVYFLLQQLRAQKPQLEGARALLTNARHDVVPGEEVPKASNFEPNARGAVVTGRFDWITVESADYRMYIENLRRIGCPEETIQDIVSQDLRKNYRKRSWEILRSSAVTNFWSADFQIGTRLDSDQLAALRELEQQFESSHRELLGSVANGVLDFSDSIETELLAKYGELDWDKIQALAPLQKQLQAHLRTMSLNDAKGEELRQEIETKMAEFLSEEEKTQYQLRSAPLAQQLRKNLGSRVLTEDQFRRAFIQLRDELGATQDLSLITAERVRTALDRIP